MGAPVKVQWADSTHLEFVWCDRYVDRSIIERKIDAREVLIALRGEQPIGFARIEYIWCTTPYIALIWVDQSHRRQGVGRAMLSFLEFELRKDSHRFSFSSSQANESEPQAWHREMGFEECGCLAGINEGGIGEIFFRKRL